MSVSYISSGTINIKGITYTLGSSTFVCAAASRGNASSEGDGGSSIALTVGTTYKIKRYAVGEYVQYPYNIYTTGGSGIGWYDESVFPDGAYTVTYNANGGKGSMATDTVQANTTYVTKANAFTRTGYHFVGWNEAANGTGVDWTDWIGKGWTWTYTKSITLYAQWQINTYTVKYNGNGNTGGSTSNSSHTYNTAKALTANGFTKTGYRFIGWNTKADGSGTSYANQALVKNLTSTNGGTVNLYAQWQAVYTISYNANGGSGAPSSQTKYEGEDITLSSTIPTYTGFTFKGWATSSTGTVIYQPGDTYGADASVTLYAIWAEKITDILIYKADNSCEAIEFIEGTYIGFKNTGTVCATEFIEGSGVILGTIMTFGELIER